MPVLVHSEVYAVGRANRPVRIRWVCSACGEANTADVNLRTRISRRSTLRRYQDDRLDAEADALYASHVKAQALRTARQPYRVYRSMAIHCPCVRCGQTELWSRKTGSRIGPYLPDALKSIVLFLGWQALFAILIFRHADDWSKGAGLAAVIGGAAGYLIVMIPAILLAERAWFAHRDKQMRTLPDDAFPILVSDPMGDTLTLPPRPHDSASQSQPQGPHEWQGDNGSFWDNLGAG